MGKELRLSPTSINTFFRCPRLFYYNYILKKRSPPNIHLYKGSFVHRLLENLFKRTRYVDIERFSNKYFEKWKPSKKFFSEDDDPEHHRKEAEKMIETFSNRFNEKCEMLIMEGKANDKNHAWNLLKPKLKEYKIYDKERNIMGIIDSIETNFDEQTYLIDYKTSKLYRHTLPEEYVRQVSIYAYLYRQEFGELPDYVGINYLRYGEIFIVPVTEELVNSAIEDIEMVREKSKSRDKKDYPRCSFEWCDCNYFEEKESVTV